MFEHDYKNYPELTNSQLETLQFSSPHEQITRDFDCVVVKVHDADTVTVRASFRDFDFPVRLADIDAPELSEGGSVARDWLSGKLLDHTVVVLVDPFNRVGKYGRLIGRVVSNGMDVGVEMLHLGLVKRFGFKKEGEVPDSFKLFNLDQWF